MSPKDLSDILDMKQYASQDSNFVNQAYFTWIYTEKGVWKNL